MSYVDYSDWKNWSSDKFGTWDAGENLYFRKEVFSLLPARSPENVRLFELGFGNGPFLGWAKDQGFSVSGSEIQGELMDRARKAGFSTVGTVDELEPDTLDMVLAFDVFEHIPYRELTGMCGKIADALKPGGFLVARFPNGDSPFSLPIQNADPTHAHSIGKGIAYELMRVSGLEVVELRAPYETPVTLKSKIVLPLKRLMRSLLTTYVRFTYLGASTPPTYALNYLLVARKPVANRH